MTPARHVSFYQLREGDRGRGWKVMKVRALGDRRFGNKEKGAYRSKRRDRKKMCRGILRRIREEKEVEE